MAKYAGGRMLALGRQAGASRASRTSRRAQRGARRVASHESFRAFLEDRSRRPAPSAREWDMHLPVVDVRTPGGPATRAGRRSPLKKAERPIANTISFRLRTR